MNIKSIKNKIQKSQGRFQRVTLSNTRGEQTFVGRVSKVGESYVTFDRFSGERGQVKAHVNSVVEIS